MLNLATARDLVMIGVVFGAATVVWAGWAQERPPAGAIWRVLLAALSVCGLILFGFGVPTAVQHWDTPTELDPHSVAFVAYVVVFWAEVAVIVALALWYRRIGRMPLLAPTVLIVVGAHFVPLAFVFAQPILVLAAVLVVAAGAVALLLPSRPAAPSFWCGALSAPVFVVLGAVALVAGGSALGG